MKNSVRLMALALFMSVVCWFAIGLVDADTQINIVNQCSQTISACQTDQSGQITSYALGSGASQLIDVGTTWLGGVIWGYPGGSADPTDCNTAKPQADLAEFTTGDNNQDSYDISIVNAYNLPLQIAPTSSGSTCGSPSCTINNLNSFCQPPNTPTGPPGDGCYNNATSPSPGPNPFPTACPEAISYTTDTTGKVYGCQTGTNYEVVFCP
ncbi:unnamed protein product [Sphagnum jensenii]|uniref:Thaumatin-like protein n=1 Tax=Sphagnum jensenii TaxID=128206 RepID=A0ABP0WYF2_9BRYO